MKLDEVEQSTIDARTKGIPGHAAPFALRDIGTHGWNLLREDLPLPLLVLKQEALHHNSQWMRRFLERSGARLAPHGKTTMSPQLFQRQLDDGAWGITCATVEQLHVYRHYGVQRVLMANQLVGAQAIRYVLGELRRDPGFDFYCLVDSVAGVELLAREAEANPPGQPLQVLLEMGVRGGRTGARDVEEALAVARAVQAASPHLSLRGVEGFEGVIHGATMDETERQVAAFLDGMAQAAERCDAEGLFGEGEVLLTAGGSMFYDMVVDRFSQVALSRPTAVVSRSGCYLTQDHAAYLDGFRRILARSGLAADLGEGLKPALELWAYVQSLPEPGLAIATFGKRDTGIDSGYPVPAQWFRPGEHQAPQPLTGHEVKEMNDQHAYIATPASCPLQVGDMIGLGISHPCTSFDKWQLLCVVDEAYTVTSAVRTFF